MKNETKVVCPVCGAEFAIGEHEHQVKNAIVIGKDSRLGTITLPLAKENKQKDTPKSKAELRIEAMKLAGFDTSKYFAMRSVGGDYDKVVSISNGRIEEVDVSDPIITKIMEAGSLRNAHLFKQHVMAQMLRMLTRTWYHSGGNTLEKNYRGEVSLEHFSEHMKWHGYEYSWEVLNDMLMRQSAMYRHKDTKCLAEDNRWYNRELAVRMFDDYLYQLNGILGDKVRHNFKDREYIRFKGAEKLVPHKESAYGYLYINEIETMVSSMRKYGNAIRKASNPIELHHAVEKFCAVKPLLQAIDLVKDSKIKVKTSCAFVDAYKGYGGYFTMQNMILFHGCFITLQGDWDPKYHAYKAPKTLSKKESLLQLDKWAVEYQSNGYMMLGALKQFIRDNNFDIEAKQKEWADKYSC